MVQISKQANLHNIISEKIEIQGKNISESLDIDDLIQCNNFPNNIQDVTLTISNQWEDTTILDSVFFKNGNEIVGVAYFTESTNRIVPAFSKDIQINVSVLRDSGNPNFSIDGSDTVFVVTKFGSMHSKQGINLTCI